jgi:hypothetical protein
MTASRRSERALPKSLVDYIIHTQGVATMQTSAEPRKMTDILLDFELAMGPQNSFGQSLPLSQQQDNVIMHHMEHAAST